MAELYGWAGKILWVDLTRGKITKKPTTDYQPEKFIGGVGLACKIFWDLGCPKVSAFDPNNPLLISVGPLTGVHGPFSRAELCSISPQSYPNELFAYSGMGGEWPSQLKYAGYDGIVILGKADKPVYLSIRDEDVTIEDASEIWGLDTFATQKWLMRECPGASVLTIGPAGENLSRIAVILSETGHAFGQGGFGAVMGSKNLKAIVVKGTGGVKIARPDDLLELIKGRKAKGEWNIEYYPGKIFGSPTPGMEKFYKRMGCFGCPYQCHSFYSVPGKSAAAMCRVFWYSFLNPGKTKATWDGYILCQKLGINTFELEAITKFIKYCLEAGVLTPKDIESLGMPLPEMYGGTATDREFITAFLYGIAEGKNPFSEGLARAAERFGKEAKDIYGRMHEGRGYFIHMGETIGSVLQIATNVRDPFDSAHESTIIGFGNFKGAPFASLLPLGDPLGEHFGVPAGESTTLYDPSKAVYEGIERQTVWVEHNQCLKNSLTMCEYATMPWSFFDPPEMDVRIFESRVFSAVTGIDMSVKEIEKAGERIWNLMRAITIKRDNRTRKDDTVSEIFFESPYDSMVGIAGPVDKDKFESLKDRYYRLRGWDVKTGRPTREKLEELDLKDVADELEREGLLP